MGGTLASFAATCGTCSTSLHTLCIAIGLCNQSDPYYTYNAVILWT